MGIMQVLGAAYFLIPAYCAAVFPLFARGLKIMQSPVNERLFGKNKTYRGFAAGIIFSVAAALLQYYIYVLFPFIRTYSFIPPSIPRNLLLGFLMGLGALSGDLAKSFFKRRMRIPEGHDWIPFDQLDYAAGAVAMSSIIVHFTAGQAAMLVSIGGIMHFLAVWSCRKIGLRKD